MNRELELQEQLFKLEKKYENNKIKRAIITILIATIIFFFIGNYLFGINNLIESIITSLVCAVIYFYVSTLVFLFLFNKSTSENNHIKYLEKELRKIREQSTK